MPEMSLKYFQFSIDKEILFRKQFFELRITNYNQTEIGILALDKRMQL